VVFFYNKNKWHATILFCLTFGLIALVELVVAVLLSPFYLVISPDFTGIIGNITVFILFMILFHFTHLKYIYEKILVSTFPYRIILIYSYIFIYTIILVSKIDMTKLYDNTYIIVLAILLLVIVNFCIMYYDQKTIKQRHEINSYKKNLPIYKSLIDEIRSNQHEYSNRLQSLQQLSETCKDYAELKNALQTYTTSYSKPLRAYPLLHINMPLLAAALYNLSINAENNNINIQFDIISTEISSTISEDQLADYFCVLLQNAIEECEDGDNIYVKLSSESNKVEFEVRNPVKKLIPTEDITLFFKKGYSTKQDTTDKTRGYGLYYLHKQILKNNGNIYADCTEFNNTFWMIFKISI
jgi:signal transduction histidine kinase